MDREEPGRRLYETSAAAEELGLQRVHLNKLALVYEQVHGELPRGQRHTRLWTLEAIERIRSARLAVQEGRAVTLQSALRGSEDYSSLERQSSVAPSHQAPAGGMERTLEAGSSPSKLLEALVGELHALREAVEDQNKLLRNQAHRLQRLEAAAPLPEIAPAAPPADEEARPEAKHSPERSAADQEEGEEAKRTGTGGGVPGVIHPIMLMAVCAGVTAVSALYSNALLLTASVVVATFAFLFSLYYYFVKG